MMNQYRVGPVFRAGLIVSGGLCAGLGIAILAALVRHHVSYARILPQSVPTPPASAFGFLACGLALVAVAIWVPRVTSLLSVITLSMTAVMAAERLFGLGPRVETLVASNFGTQGSSPMAPNTVVVLVLAAGALLVRRAPGWFGGHPRTVAILGSVVFGIGIVSCVGYMTGVPSYEWQADAPMSFVSSVCSGLLGLGVVMSACRYSELDESGVPRWFNLIICTGALAITGNTAIAFLCRNRHAWNGGEVLGLAPMIFVSSILAVVAARQGLQAEEPSR